MKIIQAEHMGMCFGVRDAIASAQNVADREPVTVLGQLVHNQTVLQRMRAKGVRFAEQPEAVSTNVAIITAHGTSEKALNRVKAVGLGVIDTTCPLVAFAHRGVRTLVEEGFHPVIVGKRGHVEVNGLTEDLAEFDIVLTEEEIERLPRRTRYGVCAQTTQPVERVQKLTEALRRRFPDAEVKLLDTVCQPTKQRQIAARQLAEKSDVVVVVGGANSNNTRELVETCRTSCRRVYHVETRADVRDEWFQSDDTVGLTAGTSTPDDVIHGVYSRLVQVAQINVPRSESHVGKEMMP